ncbi:MAG: 4Fe-4S binding protein [Patescibacteria group bacterium]
MINVKNKKTQKISIGGMIDKLGSSKEYKTGTWRTFCPIWNEKKCIHCLQCVQFCPENCIPVENGKRKKTNLDYCKGCGICSQVCPIKIIKME